jgi:hypothetical protein
MHSFFMKIVLSIYTVSCTNEGHIKPLTTSSDMSTAVRNRIGFYKTHANIKAKTNQISKQRETGFTSTMINNKFEIVDSTASPPINPYHNPGRVIDLMNLPKSNYVTHATKKIAFCYIQKNSCSSWLEAFLSLNNIPRESLLMVDQQKIKMPSMTTLMDPSWTKITVFRDPLERLLSGYTFWCVQHEAGDPQHARHCVNFPFTTPTFAEFVEKMTTSPPRNIHFVSQRGFCGLLKALPVFNYVIWMSPWKHLAPVRTSFDGMSYHQQILSIIQTLDLPFEPFQKFLWIKRNITDDVEMAQERKRLHVIKKHYTTKAVNQALRMYKGDYDFYNISIPFWARQLKEGLPIQTL